MNRQYNSGSCPKSGIKIHETKYNNNMTCNDNTYNDSVHVSSNAKQRVSINNKPSQLNKPVNFHNTTMDSLDLDIEHYSLNDIYNLFNIHDAELNENTLKHAKKIVLKMHPDKSQLDPKYFLFFSSAYKLLFSVYEFQNKSASKKQDKEEYFDESNKNLLDNMFAQRKDLKDTKNFNDWFNQSFEKHRIENPNEKGYGDWLKSDDGFISVNENVTKGNMNDIIEQKKKQVQAMTVYTGVTDLMASSLGGTLLDNSGDFSTETYTDLRQAYTQTLIPVTNEDWEKAPKFKNVNEYKNHRDKVDIKPISKEESDKKLLYNERQANQQSAALAFKYAKEAEKVKEKQNNFWSDLKHITGW